MDCDIIYYINHLRKRREKKDENKLKRVVFLIILLLLMKTINVLVYLVLAPIWLPVWKTMKIRE